MNQTISDFLLVFWGVFALLFPGLLVLTLIKLLIVLFKANRFMDEVRDYIRRRQ
ncbi:MULTISPECIES: hypothetical protein [unclassified Spirosoma]|uniref:hypothetical protein n=1 Tax=unclassified Spirosoma TaxID=2621999 RepID=UPI000AD0334E|nr:MULTISPECIES: hypothetical protein [unclassified Spirosoma]MBN8821870.1 hypothetical protein [Spirosoma sp.]